MILRQAGLTPAETLEPLVVVVEARDAQGPFRLAAGREQQPALLEVEVACGQPAVDAVDPES